MENGVELVGRVMMYITVAGWCEEWCGRRLYPAVWKSFPAVFTADCLLMAYMYYNKGAGIFDDGSEPEPKA